MFKQIWMDEDIQAINRMYRYRVCDAVNNFVDHLGDKFYTARMHPEMRKQIAQKCGITITPKLELAASALWMWREELPFGLIKTYSDIKFKDIPHHSPI